MAQPRYVIVSAVRGHVLVVYYVCERAPASLSREEKLDKYVPLGKISMLRLTCTCGKAKLA